MPDAREMRYSDVDILMHEEFNLREKQVVGRILELLGVYRVATTDQLFKAYRRRYKAELKLKYLKLAVKNKLVIEYRKNGGNRDLAEDVFFYELKKAGVYVLKEANKMQFATNYLDDARTKGAILLYNQMVLDTHGELLTRAHHEYRECYEDKTNKINTFREFLQDVADLVDSFKPEGEAYFGKYTKATDPRW